MSAWKRWRGLRALVEDVVEHGSRAVERIHRETARRPFAVLEQIPGVAGPTRVVRVVHDAGLTVTYGAIRLVNRAVGAAVDVALEHAEASAAPDEAPKEAPDAPKGEA